MQGAAPREKESAVDLQAGELPSHQHRGRKGSWVIIGSKMNMGCQCEDAIRKANCTLSCIHRCIINRSKEVILPLCATLVRLQLEYCFQFWVLNFRKDVASIERVQRRATRMIWGQQGRLYEERLWDLNLFSLHKRRLRRDLVVVYKLTRGD